MSHKREEARQRARTTLMVLVLLTAGLSFLLMTDKSDPLVLALGYGFGWGLMAANAVFQGWRGLPRALILVLAGISAVANALHIFAWLSMHLIGWAMVTGFAARLRRALP